MARVMINCPDTGEPVPTGFDMNQQSFETSQMSGNSFGPCPACGQMHTWDKEDAYLEEA
jgi:hypothetical protein